MKIRDRKTNKIFCVSYQKTGTTSVGQFFKLNGYKVATWEVSHKNEWSMNWLKGDFEAIFQSADFRNNQVFEDDPWFLPEFYKFLFHRFPNSKFVLFERNPQKWFDSMVSHSINKSLGNTQIHSKIYHRELEYLESLDGNFEPLYDYDGENRQNWDNLIVDETWKDKYIRAYLTHNTEVKRFFDHQDSSRLISLNLEDEDKWLKLAKHFDIQQPKGLDTHMNKTSK